MSFRIGNVSEKQDYEECVDISIAIIESFTKLREFSESESTIELNLTVLKVKRTIKKKTMG